MVMIVMKLVGMKLKNLEAYLMKLEKKSVIGFAKSFFTKQLISQKL